jgi:hypothetical protein
VSTIVARRSEVLFPGKVEDISLPPNVRPLRETLRLFDGYREYDPGERAIEVLR